MYKKERSEIMGRDLSKYTYDHFLKTGNIIKEYYDGATKITICSNSIQPSQGKEKRIIINPYTKKVRVEF